MKKLFPVLLSLSLSPFCFANDGHGYFVGGGIAAVTADDCGSICDRSGIVLEGGYFFNKIVGVDIKYAKTEFDESDDITSNETYIGVNLGHTFNTSWVRLYGKLGYYRSKMKFDYLNESLSDSSPAIGIGASFTPIAHQSNLYIRLDVISSEFYDDDISFAQLTFGYQF